MTAPDGRTYHDPAAEASARVFESAVDAFALAQGKASTARLNLMADRFEREAERDTARAALIAAHVAAVADADAAGYARAMGEVDVAFDRLASIDGDTLDSLAVDCRRYGPTPHVALSRDVDGWRIRAGYYFCDGIDSIAELLAVAAATLTDTAHADPPALVNGGPARDALDDGR